MSEFWIESPVDSDLMLLNGWEELDFSTPALDNAPWYSASYPESADALGFYIEEWTGLDDRHVSRPVTRTGAARGGAVLGALGNRERVMKINVFLLARSEKAMTYLFHWLASVLESVCGSCDSDTMLTRLWCTEDADTPWDGVVEMRNVALTEGLGWENDVTDTGRCFIRRASFSLTAGDPCMYLDDNPPTVTTNAGDLGPSLLNENYSTTRIPCRPSCSELEGDSRDVYSFSSGMAMGAIAPVITFTNPTSEFTFPFRAIIYYDPQSIGATPNPCGLLRLAEIYVKPLPTSSQLRWDIAGRCVQYRDPTTGVYVNGFGYLDANDPPIPRFAALPCGDFHLVLEPASLCIERIGVSDNVFEHQGITFQDPMFPTVEITLQERISCS